MVPEKKYVINGVTYFQRPLVLGQVRQLITLLKSIQIPTRVDASTIVSALGENLPKAIAIVLIKDGQPLRAKSLEATQEEIEFDMSPEMALDIVSDFFVTTPIASLLDKVGATVKSVQGAMPKGEEMMPEKEA